MSKIIVIMGATATGKTSISVEVAKKLNAEIINADRTAMYKEISIVSAKPSKEEMQGVKHHLIDFLNLDKTYTIYDFQKEGRKIIDELLNENKNIVIVGGSGLYIKALLYDYKLEEDNKNYETFDNLSNVELKSKVDLINPNNDVHINNRKRLIRIINSYNNTKNISIKTDSINKPLYDFELFYLKTSREVLYDRINKRVDIMLEDGLLNEVKYIYDKNITALNLIIGVRQLNKYFSNEISLEEAIEDIKKNTRKYAKRQETFFNNQFKNYHIINMNYYDVSKNIDEIIKKLIN